MRRCAPTLLPHASRPSLKSSQHQRPLPSQRHRQRAFRCFNAHRVPRLRPAPSTVFDCTMESYCSKIQRLEQIFGAANKPLQISPLNRFSQYSIAHFWGLARETGALPPLHRPLIQRRIIRQSFIWNLRHQFPVLPHAHPLSLVTCPTIDPIEPPLFENLRTLLARVRFSATSSMRSCDS